MNFDKGWREINRGNRLPLLFRLRLRFGLFWKSVRPDLNDFDVAANWLLAIVCCASLLGMYSMLDYQEQETEKRIAQAQAHILNGGIITDQAQTVAVKCVQVMDVVL
jgi:hypothetical protein